MTTPARTMVFLGALVCILMSSTMSFAGATVVGDGGAGLYCHDATGKPAANVLETFEAQTLFGSEFLPITSSSQTSSFWQFPWAAGEVRIWDPQIEIESIFRARLKGIVADNHVFWQSSVFAKLAVTTASVSDVYVLPPDLWSTFAKYDSSICDLRLFAIHWSIDAPVPQGIDVQIDNLFSFMLSHQDRTVLMMHEALHGWFHQGFIINEELAVRELVMLLMASDRIRMQNAAQIRQIINSRDSVPIESLKLN